MKLALDLAKVPAHAVVYAKMGHGFSSRDAAVRHWLSIYEFLAEHLKRGEDARISLRSEETEK